MGWNRQCFLPSFNSFGQAVAEKNIEMWKKMSSDGKNSYCLWQGEFKILTCSYNTVDPHRHVIRCLFVQLKATSWHVQPRSSKYLLFLRLNTGGDRIHDLPYRRQECQKLQQLCSLKFIVTWMHSFPLIFFMVYIPECKKHLRNMK